MAEYWPRFFFVFSSWSIKTHKKPRPTSSHLDQTSLINKGFIIWLKDYTKIAGTKRAILSGQDRSILPTPVANQRTEFASSYPLAEPAIS